MTDGDGGPAPGWYADPAGEAEFRWWDGSQWTEHVQGGAAVGATDDVGPEPAPHTDRPLLGDASDEPVRPEPVAPAPEPPASDADTLGPPPGSRAREGTSGRRTPLVLAAAVLAVVAVAAAVWFFVLGGDDEERDLAADQATADAAVLALADLPEGWTAGPAEPDSASFDAEGCGHLESLDERFGEEPSAESPTFASPEGGASAVGSGIRVLGGAGDATAYVDDVADAATGTCLENALRASVEEGFSESPLLASAEITRVAATPLAPVFGDRAAGWRVVIEVDLAGDTAAFFADVVFVQVDRSIGGFVFQNAFEPFDADVQRQAVVAVTDRLRSGLEG